MPDDRGKPRLFFCSYHGYADPSSGAAISTRDLLEMLTARGWSCGVLCGPHTDFERARAPSELLSAATGNATSARGQDGGIAYTLHHALAGGVRLTVYVPDRARPGEPAEDEGRVFLRLFERISGHFRPDVLLTYGGHWLARAIPGAARRQGTRVVFALHNFAYGDAGLFRDVDAVLFPSRTARDHYRATLGIDGTAIPGPFDEGRLLCDARERRFLTFVNPQPEKGVYWFARIAYELGRRRPDIPLLVVEGRAGRDWLHRVGLGKAGRANLYVMANTEDPRQFYRVSKAVLTPSLVPETLARVPIEAMMNGIPVLASRRGALTETLANGGFLFDVPERYKPESRVVPAADEVRPWLETIERLWDDPAYYAAHSDRCQQAARAWRSEAILPRFESFLFDVARGRAPTPFQVPTEVGIERAEEAAT
jgi:glycosyltransferase involved in cell wall biosynthesis